MTNESLRVIYHVLKKDYDEHKKLGDKFDSQLATESDLYMQVKLREGKLVNINIMLKLASAMKEVLEEMDEEE